MGEKKVVRLYDMIRLKLIEKLPPVLRNKYILTVVIFLVWLILFDSNNLISRYRELRELRTLRKEKEYYIDRIETDRRKLNELKTDDQNLEKFAREQYKMKKPDEDLYIIMSPREERRITRRNN